MASSQLPGIIQGGMGVGISSWSLAKAVSKHERCLGVVSGTVLDTVFVRRLQLGDPNGHIERALGQFPNHEVAQRIYKKYFISGGKALRDPFKAIPMWSLNPSIELQQLAVVANFVEVWLAKEGHEGPVGINYLEKVQMPNLASIYGAMLAGVDYILMGAGIPFEIPNALDGFVQHRKWHLKISVINASGNDSRRIEFDPVGIIGQSQGVLKRPLFLAIISSEILAKAMIKRATGEIDGFVIENHTAGGHNAPPRGQVSLNEKGEPIYSKRDEIDLEGIKKLNLPFWLAGSYAGRFQEALSQGAIGIQVGTPFAFCEESGLSPELKRQVLESIYAGSAQVHTDSKASSTGFPFKVLLLKGTMSDSDVYEKRHRKCDLGYLRILFKRENGQIGYRCPSEPVGVFCSKLGDYQDAEGRKCLCNALLANIGLAQARGGCIEKPLITSGSNLSFVHDLLHCLPKGNFNYTVSQVIERIRMRPEE